MVLKTNRRRILWSIASLVCLLALGACSTKRNTFTRRAYHNLTSHFNVYWNGEQSLINGDKQLKNKIKDDYSQVLRVYNYGTKSDAMSLNSAMDRAIEKSSICVQKHSMKFGGKERVKWIDDSYLVMAKGHFYKQDYIAARRTFDFVATEYHYNDIAQVANMWLIKTYIETEQYSKAVALMESVLAKTYGMKKLPKELAQNLNLVIADYYIATENYNDAVKYLKRGIVECRNRDLATRSMFILGQIYQRQGDEARAKEQFYKVIKRNPVYEMTFESQMNIAKVHSSGDAKGLFKMLDKMLKDHKNEEYIDRIYYAMAELSFNQGDTDKGIDYLRKSVAANKGNSVQLVMSSLRVADIFFDRSNYVLSQAYYDTAVQAMDKKYEGYDSIMNKSLTLNDLVANMMVVETQDSLLRVAAMDSITRNQLIDKIIADYILEEQRLAELERYNEQLALMGVTTNASPTQNSTSTGKEWYFYNPTSVSRGMTEFTKKWGTRKLEDNWCIQDKKSVAAAMEDPFASSDDGSGESKINDTTASLTPRDRGYYLTDLPFAPEAKEEAHKQINTALNNLGFTYMDRLRDYPRSIESYEDMNSRYPDNPYLYSSWYALYTMYGHLGNTEKVNYYKSLILTRNPDSDYAQVIVDPDYFVKQEAKRNEASALYEKTYNAYQSGQYYRVKMNAERALELYPADTALVPRFEFLLAVARGRLETVDTMAAYLYKLVKTYPNSSITPYAAQVLSKVNDEYDLGYDLTGIIESEGENKVVKKESPYILEPEAKHFAMIVCNSKKIRTEPLKVRLSDFNKKEFGIRSFSVKSVMLDDERMLITIGDFSNLKDAKDYITALFLTDYVFGGLDTQSYEVLPISLRNYPVFYQNKDIIEYREFVNQSKK